MESGTKNPDNALASAYDFMHLFGNVALGLLWAKMAKAARTALGGGAPDRAFQKAKLATGRFYMARRLPQTSALLARIESGAEPVMALKKEMF